MSIRKKVRLSYRYEFGIGDLYMVIKKPCINLNVQNVVL